MSATVIIPTTGSKDLKKAIDSVLSQSYPTDCYLVVDGKKFDYDTLKIIQDNNYTDNPKFKCCVLPINVGAGGFYGHRIYAAFTHLINTDYVLYLDQDNWFEKEHVQSCIAAIKENNADWSYSLRNIYENDVFVCQDNCESLGKWQTYHGANHIDTNSYCVKTQVAIKLANAWHGGWGQDRVFFHNLANYFKNFVCTGEYTVNYRVGGNAGSVTTDFFKNGNAIMNGRYNGVFPWTKH